MKLTLLATLLGLILCLFKADDKKAFHISGYAQGTSYNITYYARDSAISKSEIEDLFRTLDNSLSIYKPSSLISRFNQSSTGVPADIHLRKVLEKSIQIYHDTGGRFDITVYPLVNAWGFGKKETQTLPDSAYVQALLSCVGTSRIALQKGWLLKEEACVQIDVNGIAQGYSVDVIADFLQKKGIRNYLVEIGGEIRVRGKKPDGSRMKIGIEVPAGSSTDSQPTYKVISLKKGAVTTSGTYKKYRISGGKKLSHLLDPSTGYPITSEMISVTVVAPDALTADGYDNPLMAIEINEAVAFVNSRKNLEAYFIYHRKDGTVADTATKGFPQLLVP